MPYFQRDPNGVIVSLRHQGDDQHTEFLAPTHPEIIAFLTSSKEQHDTNKAKATLSESDQDFARATEDVINLLIEKNIILFTDLPAEVQAKMAGREKLRSNLQNSPYNFLDNSDSI
ncbi:hypothetical protein IMCC1989_740 [gamma proteobacterium IMCC1989]|nr:hypothetical protein IMCC1989_740 [gamma proteobacterium IMCC1989]